jgi:GNAT superfamily N-acetyltransferase
LSASVRPATVEDAGVIGALAAAFADYLRSLGDPQPGQIGEQQYLRDAFGPSPAFSGLIGELDGSPVGYLLYCHGYDLDLGGRIVWIIDLFVVDSARGRGVGTSLMRAAAEVCRDAGGGQLAWSVYSRNRIGQRFYERLGARYSRDLHFMHWPVAPA